jgi:hypothetical protein
MFRTKNHDASTINLTQFSRLSLSLMASGVSKIDLEAIYANLVRSRYKIMDFSAFCDAMVLIASKVF